MPTITRSEIIKRVAYRLRHQDGLSPKKVSQGVIVLLESIGDAVAKGHWVAIDYFGVFRRKVRKARATRNPKTGESLQAPAKAILTFKAFDDLKARVSNLAQVNNLAPHAPKPRPSVKARRYHPQLTARLGKLPEKPD